MLCTLQLHLHLLTMASKPSKTTPTSTIVRPDQISQPQNIVPGQKEMNSDATSTISTPNPVPTSAVQQYVTDATRLISSSPTSRKMFLDEVAKKCLEVANQEKEAGRPVPEPRRRPTTLPIKPQYKRPEENQGDTPHTSTTTSGSTYTMTVSSNPGETTTTTTTANTAEGSTPHAE